MRLRFSGEEIRVSTTATCCFRSSAKIVATALRFSCLGERGSFNQFVGHAAHGRDDHDDIIVARR